ncbi:hypothetical protein [Anaerotignum propionicum]|nr:hypothetical protein [Anaerotignum propionicum]
MQNQFNRGRNDYGGKKASLHNFVETLPKGYDTFNGELGDKLAVEELQ